MNVNHKQVEYSCDICQSKLKTELGLIAHKQLFHKNEETYKCDRCNYISVREPELQKHIAEKHYQNNEINRSKYSSAIQNDDNDKDVRFNKTGRGQYVCISIFTFQKC